MTDDPKPSATEVTTSTVVSSGPKPSPYYHGIEPIIYLLMCGIVFFAMVLLVNVLSAFVGAFLARVKPPEAK